MNLVKIENGIVFTTSNDVAFETKKAHRSILRDIDILILNLTAQKCAVENYFIESLFKNSRNRTFRFFEITRDGFVLLAMGYNKEKFFKFKIDYINAFNRMEEELKNHSLIRRVGVETRKVLTDEIKDSGENDRMHGHGFSAYTKFAYKLAGIKYIKPKKGENFRDSLIKDDLSRVENIESMMKSLIKTGKVYGEIKEDLNLIFGSVKLVQAKKG